MVKQREDSAKLYEEGGRVELATQEKEEIEIIRDFLPQMLDEAATQKAIEDIIAEMKASSIKDMGKIMNELKSRYAGQIDFQNASALVKTQLTS